MGKGAVIAMSNKQKINTKSSTEAELIGVDDSSPVDMWCSKCFLEQQGCHANPNEESNQSRKDPKFTGHKNILCQDNTSSIRLETNGEASSTKRTRHINIRCFMMTDAVKKGDISAVIHCPTEDMLADLMTELSQGALFGKLRNAVMGCADAEYLECKTAFEEERNRSNETQG